MKGITTLSFKGVLFSYFGILALVIIFAIGANNCGITGIEEFFYSSPTYVFLWCTQFFIVKNNQ